MPHVSYPPVRYRDDEPWAGAVFRPAGTPPELRNATGGGVAFLATTESTGGDFGLFRWDMGATPSGPDPHFHRTMSESFYVLTGTVRLYDGARWVDAVPGDFLFVPPGGTHAFRNTSGAPASMLMLFAPGAPRERYFTELVEIAATGRTLTAQEWTDLYARHDQYMV